MQTVDRYFLSENISFSRIGLIFFFFFKFSNFYSAQTTAEWFGEKLAPHFVRIKNIFSFVDSLASFCPFLRTTK